jgi:hypothetical protein
MRLDAARSDLTRAAIAACHFKRAVGIAEDVSPWFAAALTHGARRACACACTGFITRTPFYAVHLIIQIQIFPS